LTLLLPACLGIALFFFLRVSFFPLTDGLRFVRAHLFIHTCAIFFDYFRRFAGILVVLRALSNLFGVIRIRRKG
jgi:hypothetical protein